MARPEALERRLGYRFANGALLEQALTHRSFGAQHNERLEFLGDSVLGCAIADLLYERFAMHAEGQLTRWRADLVRAESLAALGGRLGLEGILRAGSATPVTQSIVADAVEAVFGAVFLDGGYPAARTAVARAFDPELTALDPSGPRKDPKTRLQEILHARRERPPEYRISSVKGAAHQQTFEVECVLPDSGLRATGTGTSRQRAEQQAAAALLEKLA